MLLNIDTLQRIIVPFSFLHFKIEPQTLTISSGSFAHIYLQITVPVACAVNESVPCNINLEMFDFLEQFTGGLPHYCNDTNVLGLTKPSLCGLRMDGWRQKDSPHSINITVPGFAFEHQSYVAVLKLRAIGFGGPVNLWQNYHLPEVQVDFYNFVLFVSFEFYIIFLYILSSIIYVVYIVFE